MTRYDPSKTGIGALAGSPQMGAAMVALAKDAVNQMSPSLPRATGDYIRGIQVVPAVVRAGRRNEPRAGAMIAATAPHSTGVEWRNQSHALARIAAAIDGRTHKGAGSTGRRSRTSNHRTARRSRR